jgi:hypothetical protein
MILQEYDFYLIYYNIVFVFTFVIIVTTIALKYNLVSNYINYDNLYINC